MMEMAGMVKVVMVMRRAAKLFLCVAAGVCEPEIDLPAQTFNEK